MDLSKRVRVLHPEGIVMYMQGIYRSVHLSARAQSQKNLFTPKSSSVPKDLSMIVTLFCLSLLQIVASNEILDELSNHTIG